MFSLEILFLPQHCQLGTKCSYHTQTMKIKHLERDFLLPLHFVREEQILDLLKLHLIILFIRKETNFTLLTDNLCDNALDLPNGILIVEDNLPDGTYCQWLISTQDNDGYVVLEFQSFNVGNTIIFKRII